MMIMFIEVVGVLEIAGVVYGEVNKSMSHHAVGDVVYHYHDGAYARYTDTTIPGSDLWIDLSVYSGGDLSLLVDSLLSSNEEDDHYTVLGASGGTAITIADLSSPGIPEIALKSVCYRSVNGEGLFTLRETDYDRIERDACAGRWTTDVVEGEDALILSAKEIIPDDGNNTLVMLDGILFPSVFGEGSCRIYKGKSYNDNKSLDGLRPSYLCFPRKIKPMDTSVAVTLSYTTENTIEGHVVITPDMPLDSSHSPMLLFAGRPLFEGNGFTIDGNGDYDIDLSQIPLRRWMLAMSYVLNQTDFSPDTITVADITALVDIDFIRLYSIDTQYIRINATGIITQGDRLYKSCMPCRLLVDTRGDIVDSVEVKDRIYPLFNTRLSESDDAINPYFESKENLSIKLLHIEMT